MRNVISCFFLSILIIACKKDSKSNNNIGAEIFPGSVALVLPRPNEPCFQGALVGSNQSIVNFVWEKSGNTDTYELVTKNLLTGETISQQTAETQLSIPLLKDSFFSWAVKSYSNSTKNTNTSIVYQFYNGGEGVVNYVPFPAEVVSPAISQVVNAATAKVILKWKGTDIDKDITGYDVYFGSSKPELFLEGDVKADSISVSIKPNTTYYWKVITKDARGNNSTSDSFKFQTN